MAYIPYEGPVGVDHASDFNQWMKEAGLLQEYCGNIGTGEDLDFQNEEDMEDHATACLEELGKPPPKPDNSGRSWKLPDNIKLETLGKGIDVMDIGSSKPRCIGRIDSQMPDGSLKATCRLPDHSCHTSDPCRMWLKAPGHYAMAIYPIS